MADTDDKIKAVTRTMDRGFDRIFAAVEKTNDKISETNIEVAKISTKVKSLATSKDLSDQAAQIREWSIEKFQEHEDRKHSKPSRPPTADKSMNKLLAAVAGILVALAGTITALTQLL